MAISFIAGGRSYNVADSTAYSITHGLTLAVGDVLVASIEVNTAPGGETLTSDSSLFTNSISGGGSFAIGAPEARHWIFHRVVASSSEPTYAWTSNVSSAFSLLLLQFRGVKTTAPWDVQPAAATAAAGTSATSTAPTITIGVGGACALMLGTVGSGTYDNTGVGIAGTNIRITGNTITNSYSDSFVYYTLTPARTQAVWWRTGMSTGAVGTTSYTMIGDGWSAIQCSLQPEPGFSGLTVTRLLQG